MSDTTRIDHAAEIKRNAILTRQLRSKPKRHVCAYMIEKHADALAAEVAALRAYARALEIAYVQVRGVPEGRSALGYIREGHTHAARIMDQG